MKLRSNDTTRSRLLSLTVARLIGQLLLAHDVTLRRLPQGHVILVAQEEGVIGG